jgi:type IV pilus assembly protein PilQ
VTPSERQVNGKQCVYLMIDIKEVVPYSIKQEGKNVTIDFNIASLPEKKPPVPVAAVQKAPEEKSKKKVAAKVTAVDEKKPDAVETQTEKIKPLQKETAIYQEKEKRISLDFQDADIKSVLRLLSEIGGVNIVSGDDVKGNVTLSMKNVPWDQALDSILDINGLTKKHMGDVISVMTLERKKKDESDKKAAEKDQRIAEDDRKEREQKILAERGKLRQILIEAKIVEATQEWVRKIGIQWGFGGNQHIGEYGSGVSGGSNLLQQSSFFHSYPSEIASGVGGIPLYMAAVNMPAALAAPTLGVVLGKGTSFLEAQLAAMESDTIGKIIAAPKVVTMDDIKAIIKQGDEIPYITETVNPTTGIVTTTITFKKIYLILDVKPKITDEGRISMQIHATNDVADYALGAQFKGNPPIRLNELESTVVVQDGDTVVIGGVTREQDEAIDQGIPWLYKIPILKYLFDYEQLTKKRRQLLIFITPKILKGHGFAESDEKADKSAEKAEKSVNKSTN